MFGERQIFFYIIDICQVVSSFVINIIVNIWEDIGIFYTNVLNEGNFYMKILKAVK
jgi:hypothetical protein